MLDFSEYRRQSPSVSGFAHTNSTLESPQEGACGQIDSLIRTVDSTRQPLLSDALLELRSASRHIERAPERFLEIFLQNRRLLARNDYLWTHRLRRRLESLFQLRLRAGKSECVRTLDLCWPSLEKVISKARRDYFEHSEADWDAIELAIEHSTPR